jgi:hypothetical protein
MTLGELIEEIEKIPKDKLEELKNKEIVYNSDGYGNYVDFNGYLVYSEFLSKLILC